MPTTLIYRTAPEKSCDSPDHKAPAKSTLGPGLWRHDCPKCLWVTTINVKGPDDL